MSPLRKASRSAFLRLIGERREIREVREVRAAAGPARSATAARRN
jgi:hypothetical protein